MLLAWAQHVWEEEGSQLAPRRRRRSRKHGHLTIVIFYRDSFLPQVALCGAPVRVPTAGGAPILGHTLLEGVHLHDCTLLRGDTCIGAHTSKGGGTPVRATLLEGHL